MNCCITFFSNVSHPQKAGCVKLCWWKQIQKRTEMEELMDKRVQQKNNLFFFETTKKIPNNNITYLFISSLT